MDYLGLFCLGVFVGTIATSSLRFMKSVEDWKKILALILPAALAGASLNFAHSFKDSSAFGCYPLGLVTGLVWAYAETAVDNLKERRLIGLAHLVAMLLVTVLAAVFAALPALTQMHDESCRAPGIRFANGKGHSEARKPDKTFGIECPSMPSAAEDRASTTAK